MPKGQDCYDEATGAGAGIVTSEVTGLEWAFLLPAGKAKHIASPGVC